MLMPEEEPVEQQEVKETELSDPDYDDEDEVVSYSSFISFIYLFISASAWPNSKASQLNTGRTTEKQIAVAAISESLVAL